MIAKYSDFLKYLANRMNIEALLKFNNSFNK